VGHVATTNVYTLDNHGGLLSFQEKLVRKIVGELREFGNVYYEICNEPYFGGVTLAWQRHIAAVIRDAQKDHPHPKLISQNIANNSAKIQDPDPAVSIFNFHYASPPNTVAINYHLNKVIGDNETGFKGTNDAPYRIEAWDFIMAGGGLYNNLDYSFTAGHENGTFIYPASQPGGGNPAFRHQMRILAEFINSMDFAQMNPDNTSLKNRLPEKMSARALVQSGKAYAIYLHSPPGPARREAVILEIELPKGSYQAEWIDTLRGTVMETDRLNSETGLVRLAAPPFGEDVALRIKAAQR
jgi:hypothetical protein